MPLQNRVTPLGELLAVADRGLVYGNRGCLHDATGRIRRRYAGRRWIVCRLDFRGWRRTPLLQPNRFTELFFLDEATAYAAGHRPCALCRRADYEGFGELWSELHRDDPPGADAIDARLDRERLTESGEQRRHDARLEELPDGAFVLHEHEPCLVHAGHLLRWTPAGYTGRVAQVHGRVAVITPISLVSMLRRGWRPQLVPFLHPSASAVREDE